MARAPKSILGTQGTPYSYDSVGFGVRALNSGRPRGRRRITVHLSAFSPWSVRGHFMAADVPQPGCETSGNCPAPLHPKVKP